MVSWLCTLGKAAATSLLGVLRKGHTMAASDSADRNATREKAHVYTDHHGRKYVKSDELVRTRKYRRQVEQLRKYLDARS